MSPRLILLDEPLAALDQARKQDILPYLERLRDEARIPMLYVSHALDEVTRLADAIALIEAGRIVACGSVTEIMGRLDLVALTGRLEAGAVVEGCLALQHPEDGLSEIAFDGGRLLVPRIDAPEGTTVRLRIRARDVMLARSRPEGLSALNILPARVAEIQPEPPAHEEVALDVGGTRILARITRRARRELALEVGVQVHAIIKSVSLEARVGRQPDA
jgi:molybdate transport system ATP-binding protein